MVFMLRAGCLVFNGHEANIQGRPKNGFVIKVANLRLAENLCCRRCRRISRDLIDEIFVIDCTTSLYDDQSF